MKPKSFLYILLVCLIMLSACAPSAPPIPEPTSPPIEQIPESPTLESTVEVHIEIPGETLVNAVYFSERSNMLGENSSAQGNYYMWLIPNGTIMTAFTPTNISGGICEDIYNIATSWNGDVETNRDVVSRATGIYQIRDDAITMSWDKYGISYTGTYTPDRITVDVNGTMETFALAGNGSLKETWFPDVCVYMQTAEIPGPYIDPAPPPFWLNLDLYSAVRLENGTLVLSFEDDKDISPGTYIVRVNTKDGVKTFDCQQLPKYPRRLTCLGTKLTPGDLLDIAIYRVNDTQGMVLTELAETFFNQRQTRLPEFNFTRISQVSMDLGGSQVTNIREAWSVVGTCVGLFLRSQDFPKTCQPYISLGLGFLSDGFEVPLFFDGQLANTSGQFRLIKEVWADYESFEVPLFFEDPLIAFEDPLIAFEVPLFFVVPLFFDDPIIGFDDPIIGFDDPIIGAEAFLSGRSSISTRSLGFSCGNALGVSFDGTDGETIDQIYHLALATNGAASSKSCQSLIWQCDLTPGTGCFLTPGAMGWTWEDGKSPYAGIPDCSSEQGNRFYCSEVTFPEAELYTAGRACARDIGWRQAIHTHGQYADLLFFLSSVAPWIPAGSVGENCVSYLWDGTHSMYGISPLAIWGTNGTARTLYSLALDVEMPVPSIATTNTNGGAGGNKNTGGGGIVSVTPTDPNSCPGVWICLIPATHPVCNNGKWECAPDN